MIIKLQLPARAAATSAQSLKTVQPLSFQDKVKADRIVIVAIYLLGIIGAVVFA